MKDIEGYEGLYAITSCGKVWSYRAKRFLKANKRKDGYLMYCLNKNNKGEYRLAHRLVAEAYLPNPNNYPIINHKNEVRTDNYINNLEWCSVQYNNSYGTVIQKQKEAHYKKIYCVEADKVFDSFQEASDFAGISRSTLSCYFSEIKKGKNRKTCGGYTWQKI